ncbi:MAG: glycosyltransferase family 2 protein [Bacteroidales bacterium]|jgi:dolichol-phosphate mannosyltransferase|nr:glycosyltransferase family 2 protein [Bacteroidales bacterium]MCK9498510.1 glycosyltransferase family 2 protein [Bacteroidales bacterium]MDY0313995.1 glycosyltransferase family 2 protein [Bacteroidales bacterium]NLB86694.1 glycosyltransferase family 2 protein [Bacteroidales bacterium]
MTNTNIDLSIILPVYNEENNIDLLYSQIITSIGQLKECNYEIIFVNDGSQDNSLEKIINLSKTDSSLKYIDFSRNFGHQIAIFAGIENSKGDYVVIMDSDLQDPPEEIINLYNKAKQGFDVVYAKRKLRKGESLFKKLTAKIYYRLLRRITKCNIPVDAGDFRIISKKVVDILKQMPEQEKYLRGLIAWVGFKQTFIEYERQQRAVGKTNYSISKMTRFALDGITSFSDFPLRFATYLGFFVSIVSFILMLWALYQRFIIKEYVQGWTSIILSVLFMGGIMLITIGIIGEYISRMGSNIRKRPLYIINQTNLDDEEDKETRD